MKVPYLSLLPMREAILTQGFNQIISAKCMASSLIYQLSFGICLFNLNHFYLIVFILWNRSYVCLSSWILILYFFFSFFKRCFTGYTGERCEHLTLTSYAVDSYEKYIAIGISVGLLLSGFLVIFYCYIRKR